MRKIFAAAVKELVLLKRDRAGLLVLFIMPAILVVVITLVQENVMELTGQKKTRLLFLDLDGGDLGRSLRQRLATEQLEVMVWDKAQKSGADLETTVAAGEYQVGLIIPEGSTGNMNRNVALLLQKTGQPGRIGSVGRVPVQVFFDPGILPALRSGLTAQLRMALETVAMEKKIANLDRQLHDLLQQLSIAPEQAGLSKAGLAGLLDQPLFTLEGMHNGSGATATPPYNPVQQNVPAWALFGMFFTAIPIAGTILQERRSGIWVRLASLPTSHLVLFAGKVVTYVGVCLCQFLLIGIIGTFLFPFFGLPAFTVVGSVMPVLLTITCIGLAACGFGILLGMACTTYEQASTLGSTAVVAAAAIGGVMVPVYAMPQAMQHLSIVSPLNWGLTAFQDLLVRGYSSVALWHDLGRLLLFFLLTILLAWRLARPRA